VRLCDDTSWSLGYKCRHDAQHEAALSIFDHDPNAEVLWTPWQQVEVFNGFCQAERSKVLAKDEAKQVIRLVEQEVRLGYWTHVEFGWTEAVRTAGELRAKHSLNMAIRSMDLFHVAVAIEIGADALLSFDIEQIAIAKAAGLPTFKLL
jgi:predicted nucleic acid-binding protein